MWRESSRLMLVVVLALFVASCSSSDENSTTTASEVTTTTAVEPTTTTAPVSTTPTEASTTTAFLTNAVGSQVALAAIVDEANANSALAYGAEVPREVVPDLTTPDPLDGARGLYELEAAIVQTAPVDEWVQVLVYPNSPASLGYLRNLQSLSGSQLVALVGGDGYVVHDVRPALEPEIERIPIDIRAGVPEGSAVVVVTSSSGRIEYVDPNGETLTSVDGWSDRSRLVVVSPSEFGWKLFWTEEV